MLDRASRELVQEPVYIPPPPEIHPGEIDRYAQRQPEFATLPRAAETSDMTAPPWRGRKISPTSASGEAEAVSQPATVPRAVGEVATAKATDSAPAAPAEESQEPAATPTPAAAAEQKSAKPELREEVPSEETQPPQPATDAGGGRRNDEPPTGHDRPVPSEPGDPEEPREVLVGELHWAPAMRAKQPVTHIQAQEAVIFLDEDGSQALTEPVQGVHAAERRQLATAQETAERFITGSPNHPQVTDVSRRLHRFEAAAAGSLDEARGMLDTYDHLYSGEPPEDRLSRKEAVIGRYVDVQVRREQAREIAQYTSEVSGPECQLPDGYDVYGVETYSAGLDYSDVAELERDIATYHATLSARPEAWAVDSNAVDLRSKLLEEPPSRMWQGSHNKLSVDYRRGEPPMYFLNTNEQYARFGVQPMERFAHIVGKLPSYEPSAGILIAYPMPFTLHDRFAVPFQGIALTLAAVTGQPRVAEITPDRFISNRFDFPGGSIDFNDGSVYSVGVVEDRFGRPMRRPGFRVHLELGRRTTSETERREVARRLSAWFAQSVGPREKQLGQ